MASGGCPDKNTFADYLKYAVIAVARTQRFKNFNIIGRYANA